MSTGQMPLPPAGGSERLSHLQGLVDPLHGRQEEGEDAPASRPRHPTHSHGMGSTEIAELYGATH